MKASARAVRKPSKSKSRVPPQSVFIYRAHKEVRPAGMRSPDFLVSRLSFPRQVVLRLVSSEASRLSKGNRAKVITLEEINAAVALVQKKIQRRSAA